MSVLLRVAYDGTAFHGFARQPEDRLGRPVRTVQGTLERALTELYRAPVVVRGASRTDAGVHALGQLVAFEGVLPIPPNGVARALGGTLPRDLAVTAAWEEVGPDGAAVDPRRGNGGKRYRYRCRLTPRPDPLSARYEWAVGERLDVPAMRAAAAVLVGTHDFGAFRAVSCQARTAVRTVRRLDVVTHARVPEPPLTDRGRMDFEDPHWDPGDAQGHPELVDVVVEGDAFLKNMVRILAGTLVDVGRGHLRERDVAAALAARRRDLAGQTAPPEGLTLLEVLWPSSPDSRRAPA